MDETGEMELIAEVLPWPEEETHFIPESDSMAMMASTLLYNDAGAAAAISLKDKAALLDNRFGFFIICGRTFSPPCSRGFGIALRG